MKSAYLVGKNNYHPFSSGLIVNKTNEHVIVAAKKGIIKIESINDSKNNHSHNDLRENSKGYMNEQKQDSRVNVNMTENFDVNLFNKVYDDNKIETPFDDGYGGWISKNHLEDKEQKKLFSGNFNKIYP